ncbi:ABC transporter ATP-binding protein/permease [Mycobacterium sp. AZCC_0083]|uniref:ABC transporter ATP-binding protein/permease n=1 Tax=Mycobacterium sp. AZCC_0083 TaxID=2735882 RepID=UPI00162191CC|nr:ABC transporter ATP-binding protein/permease [Mycobacterium sp. AZCC_0083]MBB5160887.1 putative ATP-binding cassette transporter [Mycobacterium sp. AZCC_0083]
MDSPEFKPSVDWSNELVNSTLWVLETFLIAALCVVVVLVLLHRFTGWGRQFWRITGDYFVGRASWPVWLVLAALLASAVVSVRVSVLISYYANDLFSALQVAFEGSGSSETSLKQTGVHGFWTSMGIFAILATVAAARFLLDLYLTQRFIIDWRVWLTRRLTGDWLDGHAYYRGQLAKEPIDNPDQRIQQDIDIVTTVTGEPNVPSHGSGSTLLFGAVESVLSVAAFGVILWHLSGPLTVLDVTLPKALFWIVIGYVLAATIIAFWIGRPLIRLSYLNELRNASFRYAMIRMKDSASAIGLYRGENVERGLLDHRLTSVITNYRMWLNRMVMFLGWNLAASQTINPLPYIVQAQRLFASEISFGDVMQSATAFHAIHDALSFFRNAYDSFASYRAALIRLDGLIDANDRARAMPRVTTQDADVVAAEDVDVRTPDGKRLIRALSLRLEPGDGLLIKGPSGSGKTVLLQSVAGLWPYTSGVVSYPIAARETMFVAQLPYLPMGDLRAVTSYPSPEGAVDDELVQGALLKVALPHLIIRINEVKDWAKVLSVGEQQRIAFARILLNKPKAVFLDESTSAMDEGLELMLYRLIRDELPDTIVVSVSHRDTVDQHHDRQLELLGDGDWRLDRLAAAR